jgi:hypothetical protein
VPLENRTLVVTCGSSGYRACCAVQSPVGCVVTPPRCTRQVPCSMNTST